MTVTVAHWNEQKKKVDIKKSLTEKRIKQRDNTLKKKHENDILSYVKKKMTKSNTSGKLSDHFQEKIMMT